MLIYKNYCIQHQIHYKHIKLFINTLASINFFKNFTIVNFMHYNFHTNIAHRPFIWAVIWLIYANYCIRNAEFASKI